MGKDNKQFMIFSSILILFVVDAHAWTALNIATRYLTYNMFFMQAFVFVSGYFFSWNSNFSIENFIGKKVQRLIIPYYIWWFFYAILLYILWKIFSIEIGNDITWKTLLLGPWTGGECWRFNDPSWFVCTLFLIQVIYVVIRKVFSFIWNDWIILAILILISVGTTNCAIYNEVYPVLINIYRVSILMCFYQLGVMYKKYVERVFERISCAWICSICLIFMAFYIQKFGYNQFYFNSLKWDNPGIEAFGYFAGVSPIITGVVGIAFWLKISQQLVPALAGSRMVNFVSNHSFDIMMNHVVFMWLANLVMIKVNGKMVLDGFDQNQALINPWYRWCNSSWSNLIYFFSGMVGSCLLAWGCDYLKKKYRERHNK